MIVLKVAAVIVLCNLFLAAWLVVEYVLEELRERRAIRRVMRQAFDSQNRIRVGL